MKKNIRFSLWAAGLSLSILALVATGIYLSLKLSLAKPGGQHKIAALTGPASVSWDAKGVPTLRAANMEDAVRLEGWVMARDRLFQMDLIRRKMAGRLAEIFGSKVLFLDRKQRTLGYDDVARKAYERMQPTTQKYLIAFSEGVNAFMDQEAMPWETRTLFYRPERWQPYHSLLVPLSLFESLSHHDSPAEETVSLIRKNFPKSVEKFLTIEHGFLDSPILEAKPTLLPNVPSPNELLIRGKTDTSDLVAPKIERGDRGSNAMAFAPKVTSTGGTLLAGDPHLDLNAPNVWYRMHFEIPGWSATGVSVPGIPGIVIGTNRDIAWSFTNSMADVSDWVLLPLKDDDHYIHDGEVKAFDNHTEILKARFARDKKFVVQRTPWGPVVRKEKNTAYVLQWTALDTEVVSGLDLLELNHARSINELFEALSRWSGPVQNAVFASKDGQMGWALSGKIPRRRGFDGLDFSSREKNQDWDGYFTWNEMPRLLNPANGIIASANQRTVPLESNYLPFGNDWPNAARAYRLRQLALANNAHTATSVHAIQMDTVSETHLWYRDQLLNCQSKFAENEWNRTALEIIRDWNGHADVDSKAYPILKVVRMEALSRAMTPIARAISSQRADVVVHRIATDTLMAQLLEKKPLHLLDAKYPSYCELLGDSLTESAKKLVTKPSELYSLRWGALNSSKIRHPFSFILPEPMAVTLNMQTMELPGDRLIPNMNTPSNGVSMRFVVDLADPSRSIFNQPGGQSGHPWSRNYADGYLGWITGANEPLEPGPAIAEDKFASF